MASGILAEASLRELTKVARLFNLHGLNPIVIGGWAVYYYTKGAGSVDIDIVLPSEGAVRIFEKYSRQLGFSRDKRAKTRALFRKEIKTKPGGPQEIELDIFILPQRNKLASNRLIEIPWKLSEEYGREWKIEGDAIARVPEKEVLLLYKAAALMDRQFKIKTWVNLSKFTKDRLRSKIEKDKKDILGLLELGVDKKRMDKLLKKTKFKESFEEALDKLL